MSSSLPPADYNRLKWRARRGLLELDLLLTPFFEEAFAGLGSGDQAVFIRLLDREDPELRLWFQRQAKAEDPALQQMVERILARAQS